MSEIETLKDKYSKWFVKSINAILDAGGSPEVIKDFQPELIDTLARNNLYLTYKKGE